MRALLPLLLALAGCDKVWGLERTPDAPTPQSRWDSVAPGEAHTCGIRLDHTLWCWGRNDYGQLGASESLADFEAVDPRQVGSATDWALVASGPTTSCAIKSDQTLWCWGDNRHGQVGTGTSLPVAAPYQIPGAWKAVAPGETHACAISADDRLSCWGDNLRAQLGDGTQIDHMSPMPVQSTATWLDVAVGQVSTCAIQADGTAWCWGWDAYGQIGLGSTNGGYVTVPTPVADGGTWKKLALGELFACGITTDRRMRCWGRNDVGQIGDSSGTTRFKPSVVDLDLISEWTDVRAGGQHVCGTHGAGRTSCWGSNEYGQLVSDPAKAFRAKPTDIAGAPDNLVAIALGRRSTCAIDASHELWCAGLQPHSELRPVEVGGAWTEVLAGGGVTCGRQSGTISCWGANHHGAVGDGTGLDRQLPVAIPDLVTRGFAVSDVVCARNPLNEISCWGMNSDGQAGQTGAMATTDVLKPTSIGNGQFPQVATQRHTCALDNNGAMYCWGYNESGECGPAPNSPQRQIGAYLQFGTWVAVAVGASHTCGIAYLNHHVYCAGLGADGQCGVGFSAPTNVFQEVVVPGTPMFDELTSGPLFTCARAGTAAWCWGANATGQLGNQTTMSTGTPIALVGAWTQLSAGQDHLCGIRTGGTLWCTGANAFGQLGDGTQIEQHEPVQVGTETDWISVTAGRDHTCATKQSGQLFCWGRNISGGLGTGTAWHATFERNER